MLVIIMHNNRDYLNLLKNLSVEKGINAASILNGANIGTKLVGGTYGMTASSSKAMQAYKMAFVAHVKGEKEANDFIRTVKCDNYLNLHNIDDEGLICVLPYLEVSGLDRSTFNNSGGYGHGH
ncbi:MAG: hypothetical protein L6416_00175 [Candidatus Omnitrophica bacterium]|nr:hypothetical protein [Candidatus Omnitrophota bacterium]